MTAREPDPSPLRGEADTTPQDWPRLRDHLAAHGMVLQIDPTPRQFAGGFANLNYLVVVDGREVVLRRPPMGPLPPGAHDMAREARILARLWRAFPLAPRSLHLCSDPDVLGAPFQLSEVRRGISIRERLPAALVDDPAVGPRLAATLVDVLTRLHRVDPDAVGLGDLGRPRGFLARSTEGWIQRAGLAVQGWGSSRTLARIDQLATWLRANQVADGAPALLHNDFKLDNLLLDPADLTPVALLDWDQGTRGDALFDLATLLSYWTEPGDPEVMHMLEQMPTAAPGFPTREAVARAYAAATGRSLRDFQFHRVLAQFKTAVIFQQLYARWHHGARPEPRYAGFARLSDGLLEFAAGIAAGDRF